MANTIYPCNGGIPASPTFQAAVHRRVQHDGHCRFAPTNGSLKGQVIFTISNQHIWHMELLVIICTWRWIVNILLRGLMYFNVPLRHAFYSEPLPRKRNKLVLSRKKSKTRCTPDQRPCCNSFGRSLYPSDDMAHIRQISA